MLAATPKVKVRLTWKFAPPVRLKPVVSALGAKSVPTMSPLEPVAVM